MRLLPDFISKKLPLPLLLLATDLHQINALNQKSINCVIEKDQGNCLRFLKSYDQCHEIVSNCIRTHISSPLNGVKCCEEHGCGRDINRPDKFVDRISEGLCISKCMLGAYLGFSEVLHVLGVSFAANSQEFSSSGEESKIDL